MRRLVLTLLAMAMAVPVVAQPPAGDGGEVIVQGRRDKALESLLDNMASPRMGRQIARWDRHVCTQIQGLEATHAAFVKERIDAVADETGVGAVKSARCVPDVIVIFTLDADAVTAALVKRYPEMIGEIDRGAVNARTKAPFLKPAAVRWFGQDWLKPEELMTVGRIQNNSRQVISAIVSVVDLNKLNGVSWGQLADFLAFLSLSRPQYDHVYRDPGTILSLFTARDDGTATPEGLTALDKSFLVNLYKTQRRQSAEAQEQDIRRHVKADQAKAREN